MFTHPSSLNYSPIPGDGLDTLGHWPLDWGLAAKFWMKDASGPRWSKQGEPSLKARGWIKHSFQRREYSMGMKPHRKYIQTLVGVSDTHECFGFSLRAITWILQGLKGVHLLSKVKCWDGPLFIHFPSTHPCFRISTTYSVQQVGVGGVNGDAAMCPLVEPRSPMFTQHTPPKFRKRPTSLYCGISSVLIIHIKR